MLDLLYDQVARYATWTTAALLVVVAIMCFGILGWIAQRFSPHRMPDVRWWYSPEEVREFFEAINESGRRVYVCMALSVDLIFPVAYGMLFATLLVHLYTREWGKVFLWAPLLTIAFDMLENFILAHLAWHFKGQASRLAVVAASCTALKWSLFFLTLILVFAGALKTWL